MKRFIFSILCVSVFFIGVGALVEKTGAKFKSDEKALALIAKARIAIGGDTAISGVQSMVIVGKTTHSMKFNGVQRDVAGETEIAFQFPDKMMRSMKIGHGEGLGEGADSGGQTIEKTVSVTVDGDDKDAKEVTVDADASAGGDGVKKIVIRKADGTTEEINGNDGQHKIILRSDDGGNATFKTESGDTVLVRKSDGDKTEFKTESGKTIVSDGAHIMLKRSGPEDGHHEGMRQNELLRTTLGLLLTAPKGMDVNYTSAGDGDVDGTACDIVVAEFAGSSYKLFLSKSSSLPVMMTYTGMPMAQVFYKTDAPRTGDPEKANVVFTRKVEAPGGDSAECSVKFSDYRWTGGVQLPYKWTRTGGGETSETFDVTSYDINPANIAEKFQGQKVMMRTKKPDSN